MASSNRILSVIFMLALLHSSNAAPSKLIQDFCGAIENLKPCLSAFESDPKSATVMNFHDLAIIALKLAISNTTSSKTFFESTKRKYNPKAVHECIEGFAYADGSFGNALKGVDKNAQSAGYDAAAAHDGATQCVTGFTSAKIQVPAEISIRVGYVELYSNLANRITDHL